ncbi:hypothetical protein F4775DRAFT_561273 [Biscogniauxia sp. FL1348]|nr:hypothetical protein F4775DRAFT_561273 [Biscogniauxia sp. FL1348]
MSIPEQTSTAGQAVLARTSWATELAGILPLSTFIDFVNITLRFHVFELNGSAPMWSWLITPANSRVLLSSKYLEDHCYLDRYSTDRWHCLDGRYGDWYDLASPKTIMLGLSSQYMQIISNESSVMISGGRRVQNLTVVHVTRNWAAADKRPGLLHFFQEQGWRYWAISASGWLLWGASIIATILLECYLALTFLLNIIATGCLIWSMYGSRKRHLLIDNPNSLRRLVITTRHMNETNWIVFYGESQTINSLLNLPLKPRGPPRSPATYVILRAILRVVIIGQWVLALAAASTRDWNAYFIAFWIAICIVSQSYLLSPSLAARDWMRNLGIDMKTFKTKLSSRHSLLNTIVALNPDTFVWDDENGRHDYTRVEKESFAWIDPILKTCRDRSRWEEATVQVMKKVAGENTDTIVSDTCLQYLLRLLHSDWVTEYGRERWSQSILEGIHMATKIKSVANL